MSIKSTVLFIFLLSLSMHAICNARNIGLVKEGFHAKVYFSTKAEHSMDSIHGTDDREDISEQSTPGAPMMTQESKAITKSSGSKIFKSPNSHVVTLKATNIEGSSTRRALSVVGFGSNNVKKAIDSDENKVQEVAAVIDYEPPRRTPPIHNRKT